MRLVDDDGVVRVEELVALRFRQQNAVGHQFDEAVLRAFLGETHLKAHAPANVLAQFFGNARGHAAGRNAARLRVADQPVPTTPCGQRDLRQLRRFAGTRLTGEHHVLIVANERSNFVGALGNRQTLGVSDRRGTRQTLAKTILSPRNVCGELIRLPLKMRLFCPAGDAPIVRQQHRLAVDRRVGNFRRHASGRLYGNGIQL